MSGGMIGSAFMREGMSCLDGILLPMRGTLYGLLGYDFGLFVM